MSSSVTPIKSNDHPEETVDLEDFDVPELDDDHFSKPRKSLIKRFLYLIVAIMLLVTLIVILNPRSENLPTEKPKETIVDIATAPVSLLKENSEYSDNIKPKTNNLVELDTISKSGAERRSQEEYEKQITELRATIDQLVNDVDKNNGDILTLNDQLIETNERISSNSISLQEAQTSMQEFEAETRSMFSSLSDNLGKQISSIRQKFLNLSKRKTQASHTASKSNLPPFDLISMAQWGATNIATIYHKDRLKDIEPGTILDGWKFFSATHNSITVINLANGTEKVLRAN